MISTSQSTMVWKETKLNPKRYEIYFADLNPTIGAEIKKIRPVVIISQNTMNQNLETVVVCPLTSTVHPLWRSRIQIICSGQETEIALDQIRTISKKRLKNKVDKLTTDKAAELRRITTEMYGE